MNLQLCHTPTPCWINLKSSTFSFETSAARLLRNLGSWTRLYPDRSTPAATDAVRGASRLPEHKPAMLKSSLHNCNSCFNAKVWTDCMRICCFVQTDLSGCMMPQPPTSRAPLLRSQRQHSRDPAQTDPADGIPCCQPYPLYC